MKRIPEIYKPAEICKGKQWYIYYHVLNPKTGKFQMFKDRAGLNDKAIRSNSKARKKVAEGLKDAYNTKLKSGWSPFGYTVENEEYSDLKYLPASVVLRRLVETKKNTLRRRTWQSYKYALDIFDKWIESTGSHITTENFQNTHAQSFADWLMNERRIRNKTFNGHINVLKVMFNMCVDREIIDRNPFKKVASLPEETGKNFPFSDKQKKALKEYMLEHDPDLWKFVKCIYHLFIRPLELLRVRIVDIQFSNKQIIVHSEIGKNKKQIGVSIPDSFIEELKCWGLDKYPESYYVFGKGLKPGPESYSRNSVSERHKLVRRALGYGPEYNLYSWKSSGNVDAYNAGVPVYDIMRQNRHHSLEQTMKYLRGLGVMPNVAYTSLAPSL